VTDTQRIVLQSLNVFDAVLIGLTFVVAIHNIVRYIYMNKMTHFFILAFYILALICLVAYEITAIAQSIKPTTRYLVFQKLDDPEWYHITADFA